MECRTARYSHFLWSDASQRCAPRAFPERNSGLNIVGTVVSSYSAWTTHVICNAQDNLKFKVSTLLFTWILTIRVVLHLPCSSHWGCPQRGSRTAAASSLCTTPDGSVSDAAAWRSEDVVDGHVHHSPLPLGHPLVIPQKVDAAIERTWRLHPQLCVHLQVLDRCSTMSVERPTYRIHISLAKKTQIYEWNMHANRTHQLNT